MNTPTDTARATLPEQPISEEVLLEKYAKGEERATTRAPLASRARWRGAEVPDATRRLGSALPQAQQRGFVPAGRINSAAGTELSATLINCFVQPVGDSIAKMKTATPASTPRSPRPPRPCAAAAASATTSRASARAGPGSAARKAAPPGR